MNIAYKMPVEFWANFRILDTSLESLLSTMQKPNQYIALSKKLYDEDESVRSAVAIVMRDTTPATFSRTIEVDGDWIILSTGQKK